MAIYVYTRGDIKRNSYHDDKKHTSKCNFNKSEHKEKSHLQKSRKKSAKNNLGGSFPIRLLLTFLVKILKQ